MPRHTLHLPSDTDVIRAFRTFFLAVAAAAITFALALAAGARADGGVGGITLGPISVNDGTAVVTGTVGGEPDATASLDVNGQPVGVDASGHFAATVDLDGTSDVVLTLAGDSGQVTTLRVPVSLLGNGGQGILDDLQGAGISLVVPPDGFQILDGNLPTISGRVLDKSKLASLTVNGQDVLSLTGADGLFSTALPGGTSSSQVTFVATDHRNVSQTTTYPVKHLTSVIKTSSGKSVSAAGAKGIVIAKIRFDRRALLTHRRLGVIVTIKDRRGYLIRGAAVRLRGMPAKYLANGAARAGFTNKVGVKRFAYLLQKRAFTDRFPRRLTLSVRASTPRAAAKKIARMGLPLVPAT